MDKVATQALAAIYNVFNIHENHLYPEDVKILTQATHILDRIIKDFERKRG